MDGLGLGFYGFFILFLVIFVVVLYFVCRCLFLGVDLLFYYVFVVLSLDDLNVL